MGGAGLCAVAFLHIVPFRTVVGFTIVQLSALGAIYALTWAGVAGIFFPIPLMLLVSVRTHLLPRMFGKHAVDVLDADTPDGLPAAETAASTPAVEHGNH